MLGLTGKRPWAELTAHRRADKTESKAVESQTTCRTEETMVTPWRGWYVLNLQEGQGLLQKDQTQAQRMSIRISWMLCGGELGLWQGPCPFHPSDLQSRKHFWVL